MEAWQRPEESDQARDLTSLARAWLLRANVRGIRRVERWLTEGYCSIGWREVGEIEPGASREELLARVRDAYPHKSTASARASVGNIDRFVNRIGLGDLIITPDGSDIYVGLVTSAPYHVEHDEARRRSVEWVNRKEPLQRGELSDSAYSKLRTMLTVSEMPEDLEEFAILVGLAHQHEHQRLLAN